MTDSLLRSTIEVLTVCGMAYLTYFFITKGRHFAQKQDIAILTKEVEAVKHGFNKDIEAVKAKLSLSTDIQIRLYDEQKLACFDLHSTLIQMEHLCISFPDGDRFSIDELIRMERDSFALLNKLFLARSKVDFLFKDQALINTFTTSYENVMKLSKLYTEHLHSMRSNVMRNDGIHSKDVTTIQEQYIKSVQRHLDKYIVDRDENLKKIVRNFLYHNIK